MKKNRNSFFADSNINTFNPMNNIPFQSATTNSSFYSGMLPNNFNINDVLERLAKIERQINRIEHRLNKIESSNVKSTDDYESSTNNMYMI